MDPRRARSALSRRLGAAVLALALAPCAPAAPPPAPRADPAQFHYEPLPAEGQVDFAIDARSPSFEFQSGPSRFRAFRLPDASRPYFIEVRSFLEGPAHPAGARVLYPLVALLTEDFLVSRSTDLEALRFDLPLLERTTAPAYRVTVPVDPAAGHERYLVVFTPADLFTGRMLPPISTPESAADAARLAFLGASPTGHLRITVRPDASPAGPADETR